MRPGLVYDSNARILADAVRELGGEPLPLGIVRDDLDELRAAAATRPWRRPTSCCSPAARARARAICRIARWASCREPGIVAHGVALKPGKPICLAAERGKPVVILPGFPTSAIFTFHEFVAPVIRSLGGRPARRRRRDRGRGWPSGSTRRSAAPSTCWSAWSPGPDGLAAYPMGKGSGSVTTFSRADGFVTIGRHEEIVEAGATVRVRLLGRELRRWPTWS